MDEVTLGLNGLFVQVLLEVVLRFPLKRVLIANQDKDCPILVEDGCFMIDKVYEDEPLVFSKDTVVDVDVKANLQNDSLRDDRSDREVVSSPKPNALTSVVLNANLNLVGDTYFALICDNLYANPVNGLHIVFFDTMHEFTYNQNVVISSVRSENGDTRNKFGSPVAACHGVEATSVSARPTIRMLSLRK
ncbi:hypothetical protein D8674_028656 [Pyrus ussuriensis x Pyrus communis]|uniref:Uncharacterized protein n=1 Tax=Pyrus ussuriensis x Pyrus communis TaxID=2448454 RepID=A0A5N5HXS6_9ROSA|nr:hypothetical protein D8674_028656 [Pyrus ussuriensis x Pyrus communis]